MDTFPLDHNPAPGTGPRNLTVPLAAWLRRMGFTVIEQGGAAPTALDAVWMQAPGTGYQLTYLAHGGVLRLLRHSPAQPNQVLVESANVQRLREARLLLCSSTYYADSRRAALAAGTLLAAHLHTA